MTPPVVADTGPLIALARIGRLALLERLYGGAVIPSAVRAELAIDSGRPGAKALGVALNEGWLTVKAPEALDKITALARILDPGEAEAIVLSEELDARFLLIDDYKGRRIARRRRLRITGVAGVLLAAKSRREIPAVRPDLEALSHAGYRLSPALFAAVLAKAGE